MVLHYAVPLPSRARRPKTYPARNCIAKFLNCYSLNISIRFESDLIIRPEKKANVIFYQTLALSFIRNFVYEFHKFHKFYLTLRGLNFKTLSC